jgi:hypothetical protein
VRCDTLVYVGHLDNVLDLSHLGRLRFYTIGLSVIQTLNLVRKIQGFMVEVEEYFIRLQTTLGKKNEEGKTFADKIGEDLWRDEVIEELNQASYDFADKLQEEVGKPYDKSNSRRNYSPKTAARVL